MNARTTQVALATLLIGLVSASVAEARHDRHRNDPLLTAAFELEGASRHVHVRAERAAHHGSSGERQALSRLHELAAESRDFRRTLQRFGPYARRTRHAWSELTWAWNDAQRAIPAAHAPRGIRRELRHVGDLIDVVARSYETTLVHDPRSGRGKGGHGSRGYVRIGTRGDRGHASFGFTWDDAYDD